MKLLSICIPSYNRPDELIRLLKSIDITCSDDVEVVICEDRSPKRDQIRVAVSKFANSSPLDIKYYENEQNCGYDKNLRQLILKASSEYIMYMGDDDILNKANLGGYIAFLKANKHLGYILRRYEIIHANGDTEQFRYYDQNTFFEAGLQSYYQLFRKSTFISGFCFKREYSDGCLTDSLDGTLLFQLYLLAEICLKYPSAYCDIPISIMDENQRGIPEFGTSENEKQYTPGTVTVENSINFMKSYLVVTKYIDYKHSLASTEYFVNEISKYSYPVLSIQRSKGIAEFKRYARLLKTEIGIDSSIYFYLYYYGLIVFGEVFCNKLIINLKKMLGATPKL